MSRVYQPVDVARQFRYVREATANKGQRVEAILASGLSSRAALSLVPSLALPAPTRWRLIVAALEPNRVLGRVLMTVRAVRSICVFGTHGAVQRGRDGLQVPRVHARLASTQMVKLGALRQRAEEQLEHAAMGEGPSRHAIPASVDLPNPRPAGVATRNTGQERDTPRGLLSLASWRLFPVHLWNT